MENHHQEPTMIGKSQTARTRHLGRGLESLLGTSPSLPQSVPEQPFAKDDTHLARDTEPQTYIAEIPIEAIAPNPYQARKHWDQVRLAELAASIQTNGLVQPILVRKVEGGYQLIAGERRFRACQLIGRTAIPAIVRQTSDLQQIEWSLVENIHRDDLNPIDRATAYQTYLSTFGLTQAEVASKLGEDRSVICNYLRLLDLPQELRKMLAEGTLTMGHARAILSLPTDELRRKLANRAMAGRLSVREVERHVRMYLSEAESITRSCNPRTPHIAELEARIGSALGTKVRIDLRRNGQQGKITIEFRSLDDFDRILDKLSIPNNED